MKYAIVLALMLSACGASNSSTSATGSNQAPAPVVTATPTPTGTPTPTPTVSPTCSPLGSPTIWNNVFNSAANGEDDHFVLPTLNTTAGNVVLETVSNDEAMITTHCNYGGITVTGSSIELGAFQGAGSGESNYTCPSSFNYTFSLSCNQLTLTPVGGGQNEVFTPQ